MGLTRKIWTSKAPGVSAATYVGRLGEVWYDGDDGIMRRSDGHTPGGIIISSGSGDYLGVGSDATRIDFITDDLVYRGTAIPGSLDSSPVWAITKITFDTPNNGDVIAIWANGSNVANQIWDNHLFLTYY